MVAKLNLRQAEAIASLELKVQDLVSRLLLLGNNVDDDKEGEKNTEKVVEKALDLPAEDTRENIPEAIDDDDVVVTAADHEDLHPSTSAFPNAGDEDDDDKDEEDSKHHILDAGTDLGGNDDDDDDNDDFSVQIIPRQSAKGISFREPAYQGKNIKSALLWQRKRSR
ncbi:prothymosin alpha-B-like [Cynara cardunculus var. scolymus]|uniref:prothymosin alpha-B-like n=1 Tax=Cynara cardunculus var. scolymus TaxID=59895 RepID=UPI000D62F7BD|nr:prothymosin alpha-B-like [Cynara cardunculus var. scolymus]